MPKYTEAQLDTAHLAGLQAAMKAQGREIGELKEMVKAQPEIMAPIVEAAVLRGLRAHEDACPMLRAFPDLKERFGRVDGRLDEVSKVVVLPKRAPNSGAISISPSGVRIRPPKWVWIVLVLLAGAGAVFGFVHVSTPHVAVEQPVDTDAPAMSYMRK